MYYLQDIMTNTLEETKQNLQDTIAEIVNPNRTMYFLRIENKITKEHIGEIGYTVTEVTPVGKLVDLGYFTYQKCWRNGYVTEALKEVI